jgi:hypothetical protein
MFSLSRIRFATTRSSISPVFPDGADFAVCPAVTAASATPAAKTIATRQMFAVRISTFT